ncbi:MAG: hypothetical protein OYH76_00430 [Defluviicoccus sp.]|nr:hypothetical protein [Defluviicoccus sp.]MDE0274329.1 hypothetical protein [Defluviicoccus sp.]
MARAPASSADRLSALITEIEAEAYARGQADARKELLDLLGGGTERRAAAKASRGRPAKPAAAPKRRPSDRKRAPKGSVPRFVEQALRDNPGQTPPEILARASDDMERLIKLPSIRTELRNGGRQGKYEQKDGRWFLAGSDAGAAATGPPPASETLPAGEPGEAASDATSGTSSTEASPSSE